MIQTEAQPSNLGERPGAREAVPRKMNEGIWIKMTMNAQIELDE